MRTLRALTRTAVAATCLVAGCAAATTQGTSGRGNGTQLTQSELAAANADNLYEAIAKLHPEWLSSRGATSVTDSSPTGVDIYMNGTFLGKADYMRDVRLLDVGSVRYWDAGQASARFGMGHPRGVIEIIRK
jgi:ABC-type phosphate transport system substrate-binding protein